MLCFSKFLYNSEKHLHISDNNLRIFAINPNMDVYGRGAQVTPTIRDISFGIICRQTYATCKTGMYEHW